MKNILRKLDKSIPLSIILAPLIVFSLAKTLWRMRKDITIPKPNRDMWE